MQRRILPALVSRWTFLFIGALLVYFYLDFSAATANRWLTFGILALVISVAQLIIAGSTPEKQHSFGVLTVFLFVGALLLPPLPFVLLVLLPHALDGLTRKINRLAVVRDGDTPLFDAFNRIASGMSANLIFYWLNPALALNYLTPVALGCAMLAFLLVHQTLIVLYGAFNDRRTAVELKLTVGDWLWRDLLILALAGLVVALWELSVWLALTALVQLLLIYRVAQVPQLEKLAQTDEKTGLWNARHFNTLFAAEIERAYRFGRPLSVIMTDLDLLRNVNNTYGHLSGDAVLHRIGQLIRQSLREYDIAGRFGGEEFVLVLPEAGPAEAQTIAERLRETIAATHFVVPTNATPIHVTMSLGVACFPADGSNATELLQAADTALYAAKAQGRNRTVFASQVSRTLVRETEPATPRVEPLHSGVMNWGARLSAWVRARQTFVWDAQRNALALSSLVLVLMCSLVSGAAGVVVAENALPGDVLYPVKTTIETIQLAVTPDEQNRAALAAHLAQTRVDEISMLLDLAHYDRIPTTVQSFTREFALATQITEQIARRDPQRAASLEQRALQPSMQELRSLSGKGPLQVQDAIAAALNSAQTQLGMVETQITGAGPKAIASAQASSSSPRPSETTIALVPPTPLPPVTSSPPAATTPTVPAQPTAVAVASNAVLQEAVSNPLAANTNTRQVAVNLQPKNAVAINLPKGNTGGINGGSGTPPITQPASPLPNPRGQKGRTVAPCSLKKCKLPASVSLDNHANIFRREDIERALKRNAMTIKH